MGNEMKMNVFKALSSTTRVKMLKMLAKKEMHITGLAKALGISVPVAAKHVKLLERAGLIEKRKFGRTHVLRAKMEGLHDSLEIFGESFTVEVPKGSNIIDALRQVSGIEIERVDDKEFITSIDGERGYYIYEVDKELPNVPMGEYKLKKDAEMRLKKLVPVTGKKITIKVR